MFAGKLFFIIEDLAIALFNNQNIFNESYANCDYGTNSKCMHFVFLECGCGLIAEYGLSWK